MRDMDDLLRDLRAADTDLADLSDSQLVAFLRCLIEALDDARDDRTTMATRAMRQPVR
jgi:hypothetical protein